MFNRDFLSGAAVCVLAVACSGCCGMCGGGGLCGYGACCDPCGGGQCGGSGGCCGPSSGGCCTSACGDCCSSGGCGGGSDACCDDGCCEFGAGGYRWGWSPDCGWADMRYAHTGFFGAGPGGGPIMGLMNVVTQSLSRGLGCGDSYHDEWACDPPACSEPCGYGCRGSGSGGPNCATCRHDGRGRPETYPQPRHRWSKKPTHVASHSGSSCADGSCRYRDGYSDELYYEDDYDEYGQSEARRPQRVAKRPSRGTRVVRTSAEDVRYR